MTDLTQVSANDFFLSVVERLQERQKELPKGVPLQVVPLSDGTRLCITLEEYYPQDRLQDAT